MDVQNKRVLVVGLGRSGLAVARALVRRGAVVTVTDNKPPAEFREVLPELMKDRVGLELGSQRVETFLRNQIIVTSPGVSWDLPQLQAARERRIAIYPEVEVASWFLEGTVIGITGSNGKTTTTSLLGDMLKASGFPTFVGGNIGNALSCAVDHSEPGTRYVTELSSFQLEGIHKFRPHVAVMLNLSPNHLDRHPSLEAYAEAKRQIFRNQGGEDYAVLNADDPWVAGLRTTVASQAVLFSHSRELPSGVFACGGKVYYRVRHLERVLFETRDVPLKGDFNLEDVLAATTAACLLGVDFATIRKAVREFKAVEHRLEFVQEIKGVDFYNNSKATSVDATLKSLGAFDHGVHLIMGGKDKGAPYTPLIPLIRERVREVLLIGAAAPIIAQQLAGSADLLQAGDLETALYEAFARARPGDTVLLAPACSSFDQFHDYEERGQIFKELVRKLGSDVAAGRTGRPKLGVVSVSETVAVETREAKPSLQPPDTTATLPVETIAAPVEAPVAPVEAPAAPSALPMADKTPAEKRSAARKRAREMASARGWKVPERPSAKIAPAEPPASPPATKLPPPPAPPAPEPVAAAADMSIPDEVKSGMRILSLDPVPGSAPDLTADSGVSAAPDSTAPAVPKPVAEGAKESQTETLRIGAAALSLTDAAPSATVSVTPPVKEAVPTQVPKPADMHDAPTPERRVSASTGARKSGSTSTPAKKGSAPSVPHRVELSYVYEVSAVDLPGPDSQLVPDDEPTILVSAGTAEVLDDDVMPFEVRPAGKRKSEVRTQKSKGQDPAPDAPPPSKQPKLFNGSDKQEN